MSRKGYRKWLRRLAIFIAFLVMLCFLLRNAFLGYAVDRLKLQIKTRFDLSLIVSEHGMSGFSTVWLRGIVITPSGGDTLLQLDTLSFRPDWLSLVSGRLGISYLFMNNGVFLLNGSSDGGNLDFLKGLKKRPSAVKSQHANSYSSFLSDAIKRAFALAPQQSEINNVSCLFKTDTFSCGVRLLNYSAGKDAIGGEIEEIGKGNRWKLNGAFNQHERTLSFSVFAMQKDKRLPLSKELTGAITGFDTLHFDIREIKETNSSLDITGNCSASGFFAFHPKLASDTIRFSPSSFDYKFCISAHTVALDSSSQLKMGLMNIRPYLSLDRNGVSPTYAAHLYIDKVKADDFFSALPAGMFDEVRSLKASGNLTFSMNFKLDAARLDEVYFHCLMNKEAFRIYDFGTTGLLKMNTAFVHDVYEKDRYIRSFPVGPSHPFFTPLDEVSTYFRNAVLTSEDGNFFFHNGFNEEAFRKSIAENYRAGKFVRGGSTISMQLVKNVFLTRKKTVARKAEEALIVWLIESCRLVSKERMLEVYFNIIELGPGVYGIGEASRFYFDKRPIQLTLNESVFLASLLPHPKAFRYSFDSLGVLKPYMADYYRVMGNFMLKKNLITPSDYEGLLPEVKLTGPAKHVFLPMDSLGDEN